MKILQNLVSLFILSAWVTVQQPTLAADVAKFSEIKIDALGNQVAIWMVNADGPSVLRSSLFPVGTSWSTPTTISTVIPVANAPDLAMDPITGNCCVAWISRDPITQVGHLYASTLTAASPFSASTWSTPTLLSSITLHVEDFQVEMNMTSNDPNSVCSAVVIWTGFTANTAIYEIDSATFSFTVNGTWSTSSISSMPPAPLQKNPPQIVPMRK